jgi:hypothetical protein
MMLAAMDGFINSNIESVFSDISLLKDGLDTFHFVLMIKSPKTSVWRGTSIIISAVLFGSRSRP